MIDVLAALETAELGYIVGLSLTVSFLGTAVAAAVGLPSGAAFAISRFPGRRLLILLANAFLGLPPVVVGLGLYLMLSRRAESRPECLDPNWRRCAVPTSVALRSRAGDLMLLKPVRRASLPRNCRESGECRVTLSLPSPRSDRS